MKTLLRPTVARFDGRAWWLVNRPADGWASHGFGYPSLAAMRQQWAVVFGPSGSDKCSPFVEVRPE